MKKRDENNLEKVPKCRICNHPDREEWRDVKGFEGFYMISSLGNIKSCERKVIRGDGKTLPLQEKVLKQSLRNGYPCATLWNGGKAKNVKIHRLVAEAFISNPNAYRCVNHIDGNKTNNTVNNLEWCTHSQNMKHAHDNGLNKSVHMASKAHAIKSSIPVMRSDGVVYGSMSDAARDIGCGASEVSACCSGKRKSVNGFSFERVFDNEKA